MTRQAIGTWLTSFFITYLYPAVVVTVFVSIFLLLIAVIGGAEHFSGRLRRATGALLPLIAFIMLTAQSDSIALGPFPDVIDIKWQFPIGMGLGIGLVELGRQLLRADSDGAAGAYALIVSSLGVFMLWAVMARLLATLNPWLIGLVMGGGLHVVFRGFGTPRHG